MTSHISPPADKPFFVSSLIDLAKMITAFFEVTAADPAVAAAPGVVFGTLGLHGSVLDSSSNERYTENIYKVDTDDAPRL